MTEIITIFTDGSSTVFRDTNKLKYGGIGAFCPKYPTCNFKVSYKGSSVTNQRMELLACIYAIKTIYRHMVTSYECKLWSLTIRTDSMYVINTITEYCPKWILYNWHRCVNKKRKKICNLDLIKELYTLSCTLPVTYEHIKGHGKQPVNKDSVEWEEWYGNKMADEYSRKAMEESKTGKTVDVKEDNSSDDSDSDEGC
jgi:ribonuclease HI